MSDSEYRNKLNRTFWLIANKIGVDNAKNFARSLYNKRISQLTVDEYEDIVRELIRYSKVDVTMPKRYKSKRRPVELPDSDDLASPKQVEKINQLADAIGLDDNSLVKIQMKMSGGEICRLTVPIAQKIIECLKSMKKRGWKPTKQKEWMGKVGSA